jgi:hypothetical protein
VIKKTLITLGLIFGFCISSFAQCIEQGTNIIGLDLKLGVYNFTLTDKGNNDAVTHGAGGMIHYVLGYDRGLDDRITVGGQFRYNPFILGKDTNQQDINVAYSIDLCIDAAYHLARSQHVDLYIGAAVGFSYLKLANSNLNYQGVYTAGGIAYNIGLGSRFYLGDHFAIALNIGYAGYEYPNGTVRGIGGASDQWAFLFGGSTYGIGLNYKF